MAFFQPCPIFDKEWLTSLLPSKLNNIFIRTSCFEKIKFVTEDTKVKHTNITTIYRDN